jgi:DNA polymerase (family 10)
MMRGDAAEEVLLERAAALARQYEIDSDDNLAPLFQSPPADADPEVIKRLRQMFEAGGWVLLESAIADLPADLRWLFESGAVTLEQLTAIHRSLGATSVADLAAAVAEHALAAIDGVGPEVEAAVAAALPLLRVSIPRIPLGRATAVVEPLLATLRATPGISWAHSTGSLRRGQDTVGDLEIVAACGDPAPVIAQLMSTVEEGRWLHRGERRAYILSDRVQVGIRLQAPENAGADLLYLTGSPAHFAMLQTFASGAGWQLKPSGLHGLDGQLRPAATEGDIYAALGLPCIPPEIRSGDDEIDKAAHGALPALVTRRDILGDLHTHTTWSDGRDSIEAMVETCRALGYQYVAITDHSPHSAATRNLTVDGVKRQADEIAAARARYPEIAILHGCEVDILPDGRLDFPDRVLERFDVVLASLHERAGHSPDQLMKRYAGAMRHPLVTIITHPTNRMVPHKRGYELDYDRLFALAVETRTVIEIDGSPAHLDLDGELARRAIAAGATVAIDSDCHRAEMLERQMDLGIVMARRGWVEARHVLNARPLDEVRAFIAAKRDSR